MASARLRKIAGDLRASRMRTVLVTLSIATGVAAVGIVAGARSLMLRTLDASRERQQDRNGQNHAIKHRQIHFANGGLQCVTLRRRRH